MKKKLILVSLISLCFSLVACSSASSSTTQAYSVADSTQDDNNILDDINNSGMFTGFTCFRYSKHMLSASIGNNTIANEEYWLYDNKTKVVYYFRRESSNEYSGGTGEATNMIMQVDENNKPVVYTDSSK